MSERSDNAVVLNALMMYPNGKQLVDKVSQRQMAIEQAAYEALRSESEAIEMAEKVAEVINKSRRWADK